MNKQELIDEWDAIASSLAPENLHEDGEISQAEADQKFMEIHNEAKALFQKMPCPQDIIDRCDDDLSMYAEQKEKYHPDIFSVKDLKDRLAQVGLPFEEVESGSDGVICLCFATDDEDYNDA